MSKGRHEATKQSRASSGSSSKGSRAKSSKTAADVKKKRWTIAGIIVAVILLAAAIWTTILINKLGVLPSNYYILAMVGIWLLTIIFGVLQFTPKTKILSKVLAVLLLVIFVALIYVLSTADSLITTVSSVTTVTDDVGVYVLADDEAESLSDTADYEFGILSTLDRDNTDAAVEDVEEQLGVTLSVTEYDDMIDLAYALQDGEIQAMLVNGAYIAIVDEEDDLEDFEEEIKLIYTCTVEREIVTSSSTSTDDTEDDTTSTSTATISSDGIQPFVVYISGNDASGTLTSTGRSDVNILVAVNPETKTILLVNTPRDYYVELAGIGEYDKLTHAGIYGVDTSMQTLANLYGIEVEYYAKMNFTGFTEIIDALGGVTVYSEYAFTSRGYTFVQGYNDLDGAAALAFARARYNFSTGDRQRGKNQMAVIEAVIEKCTSTAILSSYSDVLAAAEGSFTTNLTSEEIAILVQYQLSYGGSWTVETISADGSDGNATGYSYKSHTAYVMYQDEESVAEVTAKLKEVLGIED